jgi:CheY-like chemotaxis protein
VDVLIVDDNDVNRRMLAEQARRWGTTPIAVPGGRAAVEAPGNNGGARPGDDVATFDEVALQERLSGDTELPTELIRCR